MEGSFSPMSHNKVGRYTLFFTYRVPLYASGAGRQGGVFFQNVFMALSLRGTLSFYPCERRTSIGRDENG